MCEIPADSSGRPRRSTPVTVQATEGATVAVVATPRSNSGQADMEGTASVQVIPLGYLT
ncbi:hypothetical protein [Corynebacterium phocae]|uniref:hypothetical protein n=1 Tax=Corynebacterium phocae TaxID=161895 RepID=UPI0012ECDF88|nr:hypothetical protein [Corynebacterium phocae]